jgi:glutamine synthetase
MYELSESELERRAVRSLPRTLLEAVEAFAADPLSKSICGEHLFDAFVALKKQEWWSYHNAISKWEIDHYLTKY